MIKENLIDISPAIYNGLFSNKKNYNRGYKYNKHFFPKINANSLSSSNYNKNKNLNNKNNKKANEYKYYQLTDRPFKNEHNKILTNINFFNNKKNNLNKSIIQLKKEKKKKYGLNYKNIEIGKDSDIKSKSVTNYNFYRLKDINMKDILKKKRNNSKDILNKIDKKEKINKINVNQILDNIIFRNNNNEKINININNNYTERNINKDNLQKNEINGIKYNTLKNFNSKNSDNNLNMNTENNIRNTYINKYKIRLIFLKLLCNNITHKVELNNQYNKKISLEFVKNLLNEEIYFLNKNKIFCNEEIKKNLNSFNSEKNIDKSNNLKIKNLSFKDLNFEKINEQNIIDSKSSENYMDEKDILSKFKSFDLYTDVQMFDEKYFAKNKKLAKLYLENREDLLNDKNVLKEIGNVLSINSKKHKSRNNNNNILNSNSSDFEENLIQSEFSEYNNKFNKDELRNILDSIFFNFSYDKNEKSDTNLTNKANINKKNIFNINNVVINGNSCISLSDIYQNLGKKEGIKKGIHKFKRINRNNIKLKNYLNKTKNKDKNENLLLNNYLLTVENFDKKIKSNNIFTSTSKDIKTSLFKFDNENSNKKNNDNNNIKKLNNFLKSSYFNKTKTNINKEKENANGINAFRSNYKSVNNTNNINNFISNSNSKNMIRDKIYNDKNYFQLNNKNIRKKEKKIKKNNLDINEHGKDIFQNEENNSNSSSYDNLYSFEEEIESPKNDEIEEKTNNNIREINSNDENRNKEKKYFNSIDKNPKRNSLLKKKLLEKLQHNNLLKKNKKSNSKNIKININNKIGNKNKNFHFNKNYIKQKSKSKQSESNKEINDINNNNPTKRRSLSIGNVNDIFSFNKSPNISIKNSNRKSVINNISNQKKKNISIKKEVQDILYNNNISIGINSISSKNIDNIIENISIDKDENKFKRRNRPTILETLAKIKKKPFHKIKKEKGRNISDFKKKEIKFNIEKSPEELEKEAKEKLIEKKMYQFFEKIQKLKNSKIKNYEEELKVFIDEEIDKLNDFEAKDRENRINTFYREFELNKKKLNFYKKFQKRDLVFVSPIKFSSTYTDFKRVKNKLYSIKNNNIDLK